MTCYVMNDTVHHEGTMNSLSLIMKDDADYFSS